MSFIARGLTHGGPVHCNSVIVPGADARLLAKPGQVGLGITCRSRWTTKPERIVASEAVNDGNDSGQLHTMAHAARQALGVAALTAAADIGYDNGAMLKACEDEAIAAYAPLRGPEQRLKEQGPFGVAAMMPRPTSIIRLHSPAELGKTAH